MSQRANGGHLWKRHHRRRVEAAKVGARRGGPEHIGDILRRLPLWEEAQRRCRGYGGCDFRHLTASGRGRGFEDAKLAAPI